MRLSTTYIFFHDMVDYRSIDKQVAEAVLLKLENHRWYLTEETVPFVLFSKHPAVTDSTKHDIAAKLLVTPIPEHFHLGKPVFRQVRKDSTLVDFVGPESQTRRGHWHGLASKAS